MLRPILRTRPELAPLVLRLALAAVFFAHGAQKVFGWWGGHGLTKTFHSFAGAYGPVAAGCIIAAEFLGSIGLAVGLLARIAAAGICAVMIGAIVNVHWPNGFFMNWTGKQAGEGFEFHILAIAICLAIVIKGAGLLSLDRMLSRPKD